MNAKLTQVQQDIKDMLTERYDYMAKLDALKFVKKNGGASYSLKDIIVAYNDIEWGEDDTECEEI